MHASCPVDVAAACCAAASVFNFYFNQKQPFPNVPIRSGASPGCTINLTKGCALNITAICHCDCD